jgi:hypothetical protein
VMGGDKYGGAEKHLIDLISIPNSVHRGSMGGWINPRRRVSVWLRLKRGFPQRGDRAGKKMDSRASVFRVN